ncbi:MAG: hypothetical protein JNM97_22370 [Rhodoferax sp.]|nr:hypothetical protein [Rhodoferax sp.]
MSDATSQDDAAARLELSRVANFEISKLAEAAANVCEDDDRPIFHGIMARIQTLSEIQFYALRLHGQTDADVGAPSMQSLERAYKGMLP